MYPLSLSWFWGVLMRRKIAIESDTPILLWACLIYEKSSLCAFQRERKLAMLRLIGCILPGSYVDINYWGNRPGLSGNGQLVVVFT